MSTVGLGSLRALFAVKGPEEHGSCLGAIEHVVKVTGVARRRPHAVHHPSAAR